MNEPRREDFREEEAEAKKREEEIGRKGGAASMAMGMPMAGTRAEVVAMRLEGVRWGPVWAGLVLALPIQLVLSGIGLAVALAAYNPAAADYGQRVSNLLGVWSTVSALIALFIGGYVAGRMAVASGLRNGWVQGSLVWAMALLFGVILGALGAAGFGGAMGNIQPLLSRGISLSGPEAQSLIRGASSSAWWFVIAAVVSWVTACVGGLMGASVRYREEHEVVR